MRGRWRVPSAPRWDGDGMINWIPCGEQNPPPHHTPMLLWMKAYACQVWDVVIAFDDWDDAADIDEFDHYALLDGPGGMVLK